MLCGYGRGKFDRNTMGKFNLDFHFMFRIKTCDDFLYREKMMTVKEVMAEQRAKDPQAKIAYHSVFDIASTDKDAFGVKLEHEVFVIPRLTSDDEGGQSQPINQNTLAGKLPTKTFENSHCVLATWSVKWYVSPGFGPCPSVGPLQETVRPPLWLGLVLDVRGAIRSVVIRPCVVIRPSASVIRP